MSNQPSGNNDVKQLTAGAFKAMLRDFAKDGSRLDERMIKAVNRGQLSYRQFKMFASFVGSKLLKEIAKGNLSRKELEAVYKLVKFKYRLEKRSFTLLTIFVVAMTVIMWLSTISAGHGFDTVGGTFVFITILLVLAGTLLLARKLMVGVIKRRFIRSIDQGYPDLKADFEFVEAKK